MTKSRLSPGQLAVKAVVRLGAGILLLLGILLLSAGTLEYWQAWIYLVVLFLMMSLVLAYLFVKDPGLLERRMKMKEKHAEQALIVKIGSICYLLVFLIPGLDRRFAWSQIPVAIVTLADFIVLIGYGLIIFVLKENSYASRIIEVEKGQRVITTGPYAVIRHPMYLGALIMLLFTPMALGSWWAVLFALPMVAVMVARIRNEEQVLAKELEGYLKYMQIIKYRLIPGLW